MRMPKYQAWDNVKNRMYSIGEEDDVCFAWESGGIVGFDLNEEVDSPSYKLEHLKYRQYTGLTDMKDKEIWEGDILYYPEYESHRNNRIVKFQNGQFIGVLDNGYSKPVNQLTWDMEVIGNIYQDLELLDQN